MNPHAVKQKRMSNNSGLFLCRRVNTTVCVVDSDYYDNEGNEGHIFVKMTNHSKHDCFIPKGQAYCQGIFNKYYLADNDGDTEKRQRVL